MSDPAFSGRNADLPTTAYAHDCRAGLPRPRQRKTRVERRFGRYTRRSAPGSGRILGAPFREEYLPEWVRRSLKTQQHAHPSTEPRSRSVSRFDAVARTTLRDRSDDGAKIDPVLRPEPTVYIGLRASGLAGGVGWRKGPIPPGTGPGFNPLPGRSHKCCDQLPRPLAVEQGAGCTPDDSSVVVLHGEFDPGSGRTLAACLTHASGATNQASAWGKAANG